MSSGSGTPGDPWQLLTPPGSSAYTMHLDQRDGRDVIVCTVGKTVLLYDRRCIDDLHAALVQLVQQLLELLEVLAAADVADDGDPVDLAALAAEQVDQRRHQLRGQVVDAEPAGVLERVHRLRLPGARQAGDDHELQSLGHATLPSTTRTPSSARRRSFQAGSSP